ncbi:hypothetical protein SAMN05216304_10153 [Bosea sp. OK403]|uniref:hypothetical protein n=1 Tax=Bosea sp. OK403 TaxID=1855286 RepID=UPI0008E47D78|nr:hypothetical protein [Bosea sp. OK403]SFH94005.1 hypothetical protein SAMN05216304_10153 [Bosea sp. OK403]
MTFGLSTARSMAFGTALALSGLTPALAQDVIVPGAFLVAEVQEEPHLVVAPLPPVRNAATRPQSVRAASAKPARTAPVLQRVAYAEPARPPRRAEGYTSFSARPSLIWLGTVY